MVLKGFQNLKGQECLAPIEAINANSRKLFDTAELAAKNGNYGIARSLLILSSEEYIKAAILYLSSIGVQVFKINEVRKALNSHKERHEIAMFIKLFKIIDTWIKIEDYKPTKTTKWNWLNQTISFIGKAEIVLNGIEEMGNDFEWWNSADAFKNGGFYVDYKNQLQVPCDVTEQDYIISKIKMKDLKKRFQVFKVLIEKASPKGKKTIINDLNEGVKTFVTFVNKKNIEKAELRKNKFLAQSGGFNLNKD